MSSISPDAPGRSLAIWVALAGVTGSALLGFGGYGYIVGGSLTSIAYWWIATIGVGFWIYGVFAFMGLGAAGIFAGIYVAGFAAQLALRDPDWFQQFRFGTQDLALLMLLLIATQGAVSGLYLIKRGALGHLARIGAGFGWLRLFLMAVILVVASKAAMEFIAVDDPTRYIKHLTVAVFALACNILTLVAFIVALPEDAVTKFTGFVRNNVTLSGDATAPRPWDSWVPTVLALFVVIVTAAISYWSLDAVPHLDGILYLFHANYFADGVISLPAPPVPEAFDHYLLMIIDGRWITVNLPGWPAALALGVFVGTPWLVSPICAAICVLLLHRFIRQIQDLGTANLVTGLLAVSPWFLSMSSTFLMHTFLYMLVLGAWLLLLNARASHSVILPFIAGALMGWLFLSRPLEGVYMGVLTGLWTLSFLREDRRHWRTVVLYGLGCIFIGVLLFLYNVALTGSPLSLPISSYLDGLWGPGRNAIGFGPERGPPDWGKVDVFPGHTPVEALINAQQSLYELTTDLLGWGGASIFFMLAFLLWGRWSAFTLAMLAIVVVTAGIYALYWCQCGYYAGPRYWFMMLVPLLVFSVFGYRAFVARLERIYPMGQVRERMTVTIVLLVFGGLVVFQGWMAFNKYPDIRGYHADFIQMSRDAQLKNALVFVRTDKYGNAIWVNDFNPNAETPLFARDLGPEINKSVAMSYPDRAIFFAEDRSEKNPKARITAGPLSTDQLE
ncbi:MAG: hypothetical protein AB3N11_16900 [Arenibacterium sp.]